MPGMLKITKTRNWKRYWGKMALPEGAEALGLVTPDKQTTGVLLRLADGKYAQGNAGKIRRLSRRAVEGILRDLDDEENLGRVKVTYPYLEG